MNEQTKWPSRRVARWLYYLRTLIGFQAVFGALGVLSGLVNLLSVEVHGAVLPASLKAFLAFNLAVGLAWVIAAFAAFFRLPTRPREARQIAAFLYVLAVGMGFLEFILGSTWQGLDGSLPALGVARILVGLLFLGLVHPLKWDRFEWFGRMIARLSEDGVPEGLRRARGDCWSVPACYRIEANEPRTVLHPVKLCGLVVKGRIVLPEQLEDGAPDHSRMADKSATAESRPAAAFAGATTHEDAFEAWRRSAQSVEHEDSHLRRSREARGGASTDNGPTPTFGVPLEPDETRTTPTLPRDGHRAYQYDSAPAPATTPAVFRIVGVNRATGQDEELTIQANTKANAKVKAELKGIVVTEVARQP